MSAGGRAGREVHEKTRRPRIHEENRPRSSRRNRQAGVNANNASQRERLNLVSTSACGAVIGISCLPGIRDGAFCLMVTVEGRRKKAGREARPALAKRPPVITS